MGPYMNPKDYKGVSYNYADSESLLIHFGVRERKFTGKVFPLVDHVSGFDPLPFKLTKIMLVKHLTFDVVLWQHKE